MTTTRAAIPCSADAWKCPAAHSKKQGGSVEYAQREGYWQACCVAPDPTYSSLQQKVADVESQKKDLEKNCNAAMAAEIEKLKAELASKAKVGDQLAAAQADVASLTAKNTDLQTKLNERLLASRQADRQYVEGELVVGFVGTGLSKEQVAAAVKAALQKVTGIGDIVVEVREDVAEGRRVPYRARYRIAMECARSEEGCAAQASTKELLSALESLDDPSSSAHQLFLQVVNARGGAAFTADGPVKAAVPPALMGGVTTVEPATTPVDEVLVTDQAAVFARLVPAAAAALAFCGH